MTYLASTRSAFDVVSDVFRLAAHAFLKPKRRVRRVERVYHLNTGARKSEVKALSFASEIAAFNQGAIIEYVFMLAEKHKSLRQSVDLHSGDVKREVSGLIQFMNEGFFRSIYGNFVFLHRHFDYRAKSKPRIAVLGNWRTEESDQVITIFRDREVGYSNIFPLDESSALTHCARTGTHFICNDIVYATLFEGYKNPRLERARTSSMQTWLPYRSSGARYRSLNRKWHKLWLSGDDDRSSSYKSTLVVPISIDKKRLNADIIRKFKANDADRLIFGYLCMDHVDRDYFDEEIDVPVAKMVSDIVSIFSFQRLRFTDFSSTFASAEKILNQGEGQEWIKESVQQILEAVSAVTDQLREDSGEQDEPSRTVLMTADDVLLKAIEERAGSA